MYTFRFSDHRMKRTITHDQNQGICEVSVDIGEFCGSGLEEVEAPDYLHTIEETVVGNDTVPAGSYPVHCEEHGDHDH